MIASASLPNARRWLRGLALYLTLIAIACVLVLPFYWMIATAFKTSAEIYAPRLVWIPSSLTLENFRKALAAAPFGLYARNTLLVASLITATTLFFCALAGYAFGRMRFWGRETLFTILILAMVLPGEVTLIPRFLIARHFPLFGGNNLLGQGGTGLIDSFAGIVLPQLMSVFGVFLLRQFFRTLPNDLEDAARIDGASEWGIFWRVMLPLAKPALATLGIFTFTGIWDEFVWPLVILNDPDKYMVQLGLSVFFSEHAVDWGPLMAASTLISLPVIMVFLGGQRFIVKGIATTGLKG
ncbi:carbohydrate ABC transporter permease [Kallotenue papyrolyticum]|uniref:carbohydrate ABC transporter permease n=1 Tax=Kallotenue papyrolyticum TaxID=1325125 RepID=UPI000492AF4A|nr:carbohydrate ABC transporter permease [Kallotenue papyrolyticum]